MPQGTSRSPAKAGYGGNTAPWTTGSSRWQTARRLKPATKRELDPGSPNGSRLMNTQQHRECVANREIAVTMIWPASAGLFLCHRLQPVVKEQNHRTTSRLQPGFSKRLEPLAGQTANCKRQGRKLWEVNSFAALGADSGSRGHCLHGLCCLLDFDAAGI